MEQNPYEVPKALDGKQDAERVPRSWVRYFLEFVIVIVVGLAIDVVYRLLTFPPR